MNDERPQTEASFTCVWCGAPVEAVDGVWTDRKFGGGDYCSEGKAVGPTGTSPHLPAEARASSPAPDEGTVHPYPYTDLPDESPAPGGPDVERLRKDLKAEFIHNGSYNRTAVWMGVDRALARLSHQQEVEKPCDVCGSTTNDHDAEPHARLSSETDR